MRNQYPSNSRVLTTILDDALHRYASEIRSKHTPSVPIKSVVFTQEMFPVSIETKCDGNYYPPNTSKVELKGLVLAGALAVNSYLTLELDAESAFAQQLRAAVHGRKKYKLTLEETEETF